MDLIQFKHTDEFLMFFKLTYNKKDFYSKQEFTDYYNSRHKRTVYNVNSPMNINTLLKFLNKGKEFLHCFNVHRMNSNGFSKKAFMYTYVIPIDIDYSNISLEEALGLIKSNNNLLVPTIAYETFSSTDTAPRFRFLYIFKNEIKQRAYKRLYKQITEELTKILGIQFDKCFNSEVQHYLGTSKDSKVYYSKYIYADARKVAGLINRIQNISFTDANIDKLTKEQEEFLDYLMNIDYEAILDTLIYAKNILYDKIWDETLFEIDNSRLKEIYKELFGEGRIDPLSWLNKHKEEYSIYNKSFVNFDNQNWIERPNDYINIDWFRLHIAGKTYRRKDGQRRKQVLSVIALLRRYIKKDITPDELFYNMIHELINYIDNSEDKIHIKQIYYMVKNHFQTDPISIEEVTDILEGIPNRPKLIHNPDSNSKKGIKHKQHKQQTRSLWHSLVNLNNKSKDDYELILQSYPDVTYSSYRKYRSLLKNK